MLALHNCHLLLHLLLCLLLLLEILLLETLGLFEGKLEMLLLLGSGLGLLLLLLLILLLLLLHPRVLHHLPSATRHIKQ